MLIHVILIIEDAGGGTSPHPGIFAGPCEGESACVGASVSEKHGCEMQRFLNKCVFLCVGAGALGPRGPRGTDSITFKDNFGVFFKILPL